MEKYSMNFGKKERVLNYACQTYQLSRPNKVGAVMALIRDCQPVSYEEWQKWYFENAHTAGKNSTKITVESLKELGERLYAKIKEVVIPEWEAAFRELTEQDCIDYIYNLTINRTCRYRFNLYADTFIADFRNVIDISGMIQLRVDFLEFDI